jgi:hypothetical protein
MTPFCNNLRKGDVVVETLSKRTGTVQMNPRPTSLNVSVLFDGLSAQRYVPLKQLRLVVDGRPEDVPPIDGKLPEGPHEEDPTEVPKFSAEDRILLAQFTAGALSGASTPEAAVGCAERTLERFKERFG